MSALPKIEFITHRAKFTAAREQTVDVLIRITPPELQATNSRPTLNLSLVLDRSGSMGGIKIEHARRTANFCVDQMLASDRLSVIVFDEEVRALFTSQHVTDKQMMKDLIGRVDVRGTTALHEAWVRGGLEVSEHLLNDGINRVVLITDGQANVGLTDTDQIVTQTMELHRRGVSTSTVGIGEDFNEDLLQPMAESAGGNAWHVEKPEDLQRIFQVELEGLVAQYAHRVSLGLIPADGVRIVDMLNDFELTETGRYSLPNLQYEAPLDLVVSLKVPAQEIGTRLRLLDLRLGMTRQEGASAEVVKEAFVVDVVDQKDWEQLPENNEVIKARQLLMNARARREAMGHMDVGDYTGAQQVLAHALGRTQAVAASFSIQDEVQDECNELNRIGTALFHREARKRSRKELAYSAAALRRSKK